MGFTAVPFLVSAGYRHPSPTTVARTVRILHTLLSLISKHLKCDKFEVNTQSVAYLAGMLTVLPFSQVYVVLHLLTSWPNFTDA